VIVIGVTGHRFLVEVDQLESGIDRALARIAQKYPGEAWSMISALAEGADLLVAGRIRHVQPCARLIVTLPFPIEEYQADFSGAESRQEFLRLLDLANEVIQPDETVAPKVAYREAGKVILERSTVLVALWDGRPAQGSGGTAEIVEIARQRQIPLAWVHCGNRQPGTSSPSSLGAEQGMVSFEAF
jgi:hypothetical protein